MDTTPLSKDMTVKYELGKPLTVELNGGTSLTGFVHAVDYNAGILCLELIPSAEPALVSIQNIKATATIAVINPQQQKRKWPSKRSLFNFLFSNFLYHKLRFFFFVDLVS